MYTENGLSYIVKYSKIKSMWEHFNLIIQFMYDTLQVQKKTINIHIKEEKEKT